MTSTLNANNASMALKEKYPERIKSVGNTFALWDLFIV